jgi:hypothetical protein
MPIYSDPTITGNMLRSQDKSRLESPVTFGPYKSSSQEKMYKNKNASKSEMLATYIDWISVTTFPEFYFFLEHSFSISQPADSWAKTK